MLVAVLVEPEVAGVGDVVLAHVGVGGVWGQAGGLQLCGPGRLLGWGVRGWDVGRRSHVAVWGVHDYATSFWAHGVDEVGFVFGRVGCVGDELPGAYELVSEGGHVGRVDGTNSQSIWCLQAEQVVGLLRA